MISALLLALLLSDPASAARQWAPLRLAHDADGWDAGAKAIVDPKVSVDGAIAARKATYMAEDRKSIGPLIAPILAAANLQVGDEPTASQRATISGWMRGIAAEERVIVESMTGSNWTWVASIAAMLTLFLIVFAVLFGLAIKRRDNPSVPQGFGFDVDALASKVDLDARLAPLSARLDDMGIRMLAAEKAVEAFTSLDFARLPARVEEVEGKAELTRAHLVAWMADWKAYVSRTDEGTGQIKRDLGELAKVVDKGFKSIESERLSDADRGKLDFAFTILAEHYGGKPAGFNLEKLGPIADGPDLTERPA